MRVGFFQFNPEFGNVRKNLDRVLTALKDVRADLVVLPELPFSGYFFKDRQELAGLAEEIPGSATIDALAALCRRQGLYIVTGFAEKAAGKLFNSAVLIGPRGVLHIYRKLHLFNTEKEYFDPGDTPLEAVTAAGARIGLMVCYDWRFPEVARVLTLKGAQLICQPANLVLPYCQQTMLTRSLENNVFTVTANRYGTEHRPHGELTFTGQSQITDPRGNRLCRALPDADALYVRDVDIALADDKKMTARNDLLSDRRPEFYDELAKMPEVD
jgi:predicted amidohydrolase